MIPYREWSSCMSMPTYPAGQNWRRLFNYVKICEDTNHKSHHNHIIRRRVPLPRLVITSQERKRQPADVLKGKSLNAMQPSNRCFEEIRSLFWKGKLWWGGKRWSGPWLWFSGKRNRSKAFVLLKAKSGRHNAEFLLKLNNRYGYC